ncbi:MAG: ATP-binding protein [Cyanothece sp. SIO2G6]|nr:ATP-binding protein [Cyanothece sp. SIO2G6]
MKTSEVQLERLKESYQRAKDLQKRLEESFATLQDASVFLKKFINGLKKIGLLSSDELREELESSLYAVENILVEYGNSSIENIVIYSPEETALRNLYREGQIEPLGIHGEGLLKLIKVLANDESGIPMETIKESLTALGWFEDIEVSNSKVGFAEEERISIFDRFTRSWFDQRSANEGFLFVLFYTALMVSKDTPSIFAIDNMDASLNPKLCTKIITDMVKLAQQFDKQCFLTAHNPAVLDGIDLGDDEQRLFVVSRNRKGHTRVKRIGIEDKPFSATGEDLKLSEAFLRGYLGGLPKNF